MRHSLSNASLMNIFIVPQVGGEERKEMGGGKNVMAQSHFPLSVHIREPISEEL